MVDTIETFVTRNRLPEHAAGLAVLARLKDRISRELREYPYPIAGCDEVFKLLVLQKECCRIALGGIEGDERLTVEDAAAAIRDLLATPVAMPAADAAALQALVLACGA